MAYHSFEDLEVWKRACRLAVEVYRQFGRCRDYGFKDQVTRSAVSIASNIAEGAERTSKADFNRFLNIAKGSAAELRTQIYIAQSIELLEPHQAKQIADELKQISAMLQGLAKSLNTEH